MHYIVTYTECHEVRKPFRSYYSDREYYLKKNNLIIFTYLFYRKFLKLALEEFKMAAGNFYINDKSTGSVVGQQPFGGGRHSGTNDKAGGPHYCLRWGSPQSIKETFVPLRDIEYPYMNN